jgi:hypothetical protein
LPYLYRVAIPLLLAVTGFSAGGVLAVQLFIDPADGLAAGATVAASAIGGGIIGLAAGVIAALRMSADRLPRAAATAAVAALASFVAVQFSNSGTAGRQVVRFEEPGSVPLPSSSTEPTLPPAGTRDSLIALAIARPEILAAHETREIDYEQPAITIYGESQGFYLVAPVSGGRAWVRASELGAIHRVEQLVQNRLNYLTGAWDGHVRATPDRAASAIPVAIERTERAEYPANVLNAHAGSDGIWLRVQILDASPCDGGEPRVIASGWIPMWGADGRPAAWFYSRGC